MNSIDLDHTVRATTLDDLEARGVLLRPGSERYDEARVAWNLAVDLRPAAVAVPTSVDDVVAVVCASAAAGLRVVAMSTGHGMAPLAEASFEDVVLVRLSGLTGATVDPEARIARVLGGTVWAEVVSAASAHGLTALHGSAPDVGVAGYVLGGGLSFYARRHGIAANSVTAVEIVTADGAVVRATADEQPDLFWAVRGGGGGLGVVVALEVALLPYPDVFAGMLLWDRQRAPEVLAAWVAWSRTAPDSATTAFRVMSFPPVPELPPFLSGRDVVVIDGAILEDDDVAAAMLAPLRALEPEVDTFARIPALGVLDVHMDPPTPVPAVSDHAVLGELDDDAIAALLDQVGPGTTSGLMVAELRHLGGALARDAEDAGALRRYEGDYALFCVAVAPTPQAAVAGKAAAFGVVRAMARWGRVALVPTFTEGRVDASRFHDGEDWARLCELRASIDPRGTFTIGTSGAIR